MLNVLLSRMYRNHRTKGSRVWKEWESMLLARCNEMNRKERKTQRGITKDPGSVALNLPFWTSPTIVYPHFPRPMLAIFFFLLFLSLSLSFRSGSMSSSCIIWKTLENAHQFRVRFCPWWIQRRSRVHFIKTLTLNIKQRRLSCVTLYCTGSKG